MTLRRNLKFILLRCCIIVTLYQLSTCSMFVAESVDTQTGTLQPESQDTETIQSPRRQCSNSLHGVPGIPGIPGNAGPVGPPGLKGQDGLNGLKGDKGDQGQKGDGQIGQKGVQGKPGPKGETGHHGDKGMTGESGPRGPKGKRGLPGLDGLKGERCEPGEIQQAECNTPRSKVAFSVAELSFISRITQSSRAVRYNKVHTNIGDGYSKSTGKFTCSIPGVYFFTISGVGENPHSEFYICLMKNDEQLPCAHAGNFQTEQGGSASNSVIVTLQRGDTVWVKLHEGFALYGSSTQLSTFTGYLLYENSPED
ncbi:complement C1q subcomponent subunit B-like [Ptychodera flava]|uniref:complement C1q subcomponent subunit B-like n=1 Tax=Ptychodera flava TaxID=63121 RepID=UPI00396A5DFC